MPSLSCSTAKYKFCDRIFDQFLSKLRPNFRFVTNFLIEMGWLKNYWSKFVLWLTDIRSKYVRPILEQKKSVTNISDRVFDGRTRSQNTVVTKLWPAKVDHKKLSIHIVTYFSVTKASQFGLVNSWVDFVTDKFWPKSIKNTDFWQISVENLVTIISNILKKIHKTKAHRKEIRQWT